MPIRGFEYDVFISYAGVNDRDEREDFDGETDRGWVSLFQQRLEETINGRRSTSVKIWYDKSAIPRGEVFSDAIVEGAGKSAILVALLSVPYLARPWCKREISTFFEQDAGLFPFKVGNDCRLVPVLLEHLSCDTYEDLVKPLDADAEAYARRPYKMFDLDQTSVSHRLKYSSKATRDGYNTELTRLAKFISDLLDNMHRTAPNYAQIVRNSRLPHIDATRGEPAKCVFIDALPERYYALAPAGCGASKLRKQVRSALDQKKLNVIDLQRPADVSADEYANAVAAAITRADAVLHIIDVDQADRFSDQAFAQLEQCSALATASADKTRIVWISERTLQAKLPEHQDQLIKQLQSTSDPRLRVVLGDSRTLLWEVESVLGVARPAYARSRRLPSWYISYQGKDDKHMKDVTERLEKLKAGEIFSIDLAESADSTDSGLIRLHKSRLRSCEGLVFVYSGESRSDYKVLHQYGVDIVRNLRNSGKLVNRSSLIYEPQSPPGVKVDNGVKSPLWLIAHGPADPQIDKLVGEIQASETDA